MAIVVTKKGDKGLTQIKSGRVSKTHPTVRLLGKIDTLNSYIGHMDVRPDIQQMLYEMSGRVSGFVTAPTNALLILETEIAEHDLEYIASKFVRPRDALHVIRALVRETEIAAWEAGMDDEAQILNRLSDLYFIRAVNDEMTYEDGYEE